MKLISVSIEKLHKYISTEIKFDNDLNIITGINGSGKTQILRLIDATFRLNINYLNNIDFYIFELVFEHERKIYNVAIKKEKNNFNFSIDDESITLFTGKNLNSVFIIGENIQEDFISLYQEKISNNSSKFIVFSEIKPPLLLGLNRIVEIDDETEDKDSFNLFELRQRHKFFEPESKLNKNTIHNDHMMNSISQCKKLIMRESDLIKKYADTQASVLRNKIISSSFDYLDGDFFSHDDLSRKIENVYKRKNSIIEEIAKLEINDSNTTTQMDAFFTKLEKLANTFFHNDDDENKKLEVTFELLLNLSQIERISNILSIIDENKKIMDVKKEKLNLFINTVNEFFKYTRKKIVISNVGKVNVAVNENHKVELHNLSSGEMQLISIISNMVFCNNSRGLVVIIDEPEVSLHIKWQEIFIDVLQNIKKDAQLILATHSPDIIGDNEEFCRPIINNNENKNG